MQFAHPNGPAMQLSHSGSVITGSLLIAFAFNLLPWSVDWLWLRPDFLLLVTLYWAIYQPNRIGMGTAWWLGLLVDLTDGTILGQHALAYTTSIFVLLLLQRRMFNFPPWQQASHIIGFLLIEQLVSVLIATFAGDDFHALKYFSSILTGALCWVPLWMLLHRLRTPETSEAQ